jgi:Putative zinc-finger
MSPRLRRRPDQWADAHERARARAAERLDGPLGLAESTWLDEHLAGCPSCAAIAAAYEADRQALRSLRDDQPEPPRDLWARTAAAIEQLSLESGAGVEPTSTEQRRRLLSGLPLGAMSAVAVVVVVIGATILSNGITQRSSATASDAAGAGASPAASNGPPDVASGPGAEPTPFKVGAGDVAWIDSGPNGVAFSTAQVTEVCPAEGASGCPAISDQSSRTLALSSRTRTIIGSPTRKQAVAIAEDTTAGDRLIVVQLPRPDTASPSPPATASASPSVEPSNVASEPPDASSPPSEGPSPSVTVSESASPSPFQTPEPTTAAELAIASGIEVVGESAAFSSDGAWFAFTARPGDGSAGPDVWVWHVGAPKADRLTDDGASYFASWSGDRAVVSRPVDSTATSSDAISVLIDPATGDTRELGKLWRPMVDPSGRFAIAWEGTVERAHDTGTWVPGRGRLALVAWSDDGDTAGPKGSDDQHVVTDKARGDFDVRWDETGEWVAVWVGDEREANIGRLTLYHVDTGRERLETAKDAPAEVPALPGFSIGSSRLAWATPRGQGGEGSRVQIAAWSNDGVGIVESSPGEDVRIIR